MKISLLIEIPIFKFNYMNVGEAWLNLPMICQLKQNYASNQAKYEPTVVEIIKLFNSTLKPAEFLALFKDVQGKS